ncbi:hypothetical protein [Rubrivirga sp. IMCC43871]|uniref:hypothetical protein n=1 Tax=Rubrivirga sp. IMCC43871 TaxID=3391575 RepID=UPI0039902BAD
MTDPAHRLDDFPALSPAERAEIERLLADRPDLADALDEARRLAALVDAARARPDPGQSVVGHRLGLDDLSMPVDPEATARLGDRIDTLDAGAEDVIARFERLTGRALPSLAHAPNDAPDTDAPSSPATAPLTLLDRPPVHPVRPRWRRASTWARAAAVLLVGYGALFLASQASVSERAQIAALSEIEIDAPALRSADPTPDADRLIAAAEAVRDARRSTLGLFPSYDTTALDAAAADLADLSDSADRRTWVSQEARLALGRVLLHRGRDADAARVLGDLVEQGGYRAPAARRLLDAVRSGS